MTERFENPPNDPRVPPHQLLLSALRNHLAPQNHLARVVWGERPTLVLGGDGKVPQRSGGEKKYGVSLSCGAWALQDSAEKPGDVMYDIHLISRDATETVTRLAVCHDTLYGAVPMGPLTLDKLQNPTSERVVRGWVHFLHTVRFSEQSTDGAYDHLSAWGVIDASGLNDTLHPDDAAYNYMDRFYQETGGQE